MTNGRKYTAEFKEEAVKLFREREETISQIARDLGINPGVLGKWIKKYNEKKSAANAFPGRGRVAPYNKKRVSKSNKGKRHFKKSPGIFCKLQRFIYQKA